VRGWGRLAALLAALWLLPWAALPHYLVPDSAGHLAWLRSLLYDRDIDFANDYTLLGMIDREGTAAFGATTATGRRGNPFGIGSALAWAPGAALAAGIGAVTGAAGDGRGTLMLAAVAAGTWTCVLIAIVALAHSLARLGFSPGVRRLALAAACLGTPLPYYGLQMTSYSHAVSAAAVAVTLTLALQWRGAWTTRRAALLGLAAGFAGLVRAQDLALAVVPLVIERPWRRSAVRCGGWRAVAAYAGGVAVAFAPQAAAWSVLYGSPLAIPQGSAFLSWSAGSLTGVLVSSRHGLFAWSPVCALALVGWVGLVRRPDTRALGAALLIAFGLQWLTSAAASDWWAGWSFGARRFTSLVPFVAVGLAALLSGRRETPSVRETRGAHGIFGAPERRAARAAVVLAVALALVQWLRFASRAVPGDEDPGFAVLWGRGFWEFLPRLPTAIASVVRAHWTDVQVLRRAGAPLPRFVPDPAVAHAVFHAFWCAAVAAAAWAWARRGRRSGVGSPPR
jgi:hypothetical protein